MAETYCKYNPSGNPYWCNVIWGYCQFQTPDTTNQHCPIYAGYPKWPIHVKDVDDQFIQTYSYATIYDDGDCLVSLGDNAFQYLDAQLSLEVPDVRYIGRYAFQNCTKLKILDFRAMSGDFIPVLASPTAFMMDDKETFVNETFQVLVPQRLFDKWIQAPNWCYLYNYNNNFIKGA